MAAPAASGCLCIQCSRSPGETLMGNRLCHIDENESDALWRSQASECLKSLFCSAIKCKPMEVTQITSDRVQQRLRLLCLYAEIPYRTSSTSCCVTCRYDTSRCLAYEPSPQFSRMLNLICCCYIWN